MREKVNKEYRRRRQGRMNKSKRRIEGEEKTVNELRKRGKEEYRKRRQRRINKKESK